ncbi:MAG: carboxypeptidase-like regulatory domain-containing protein [Gammaproteobacteria bacterium]|nr:carboxypeptidase-like regulatory domain-containing protein [Gammaproteobacteria bacterium]
MALARLSTLSLTLLFAISLAGCGSSGGSSPPPPTITISGTVSSATDGLAIKSAQVRLVNIQTQQYEVDPVLTDANGFYTFKVSPGSYEVRVAAQGHKPSPVDGIAGIPVSQTSTFDVALRPIDPGVYGSLKMHLVGYNESNGALVILNDPSTGDSYTGTTSNKGDLTMYNIPVAAGNYSITIKALGHETYTYLASITISDGVETVINNITLTAINGFSVSGAVTFLAVANGEVDVSLTDKDTGAVIPGTNVTTVNANYLISSVAPGSYYIRASFNVDGYVVDPDSIVKFGEPEAVVAAADLTNQNIDVTGAVALTSPVTNTDGTPVEVNSLTPTLSWQPYSSTSDYVVEVRDANGDVVWGGFDATLNKLVNPSAATTSIVYSNDGLGLPLENGKVYRWKVYASKDDVKEATGWKLISASEDAQGVFKVVIP